MLRCSTMSPENPGTLNSGTLELWNLGTSEPWNSGTLEPWNLEDVSGGNCRVPSARNPAKQRTKRANQAGSRHDAEDR